MNNLNAGQRDFCFKKLFEPYNNLQVFYLPYVLKM